MPALNALVLESDDPGPAEKLWAALGLADRITVRAPAGDSSGFRGFTLSLVCRQPGNVDALAEAATAAGATAVKPAAKSLWGYGTVLRTPDGALLKIACSAKKDTAPAAAEFDDLVLLLGVEDVKASRRFYAERGLAVGKSFGARYVEFAVPDGSVKLALYSRKAAAKDAGVDPEGSGGHRLAVRGDLGAFTDPDGFAWE